MCWLQGVNPWIEVDGGVTPDNAWKVIEAGANALVAGSAVFNTPSYKDGECIHIHTACVSRVKQLGVLRLAGQRQCVGCAALCLSCRERCCV